MTQAKKPVKRPDGAVFAMKVYFPDSARERARRLISRRRKVH